MGQGEEEGGQREVEEGAIDVNLPLHWLRSSDYYLPNI